MGDAHQATVNFIRRNGKGVFYANAKWSSAPSALSIPVDDTHDAYTPPLFFRFTPHQVSSETSKASSAPCITMASGGGLGIKVGTEVAQDCYCTCFPVEAIRMGTGVPIQMGRLTDGALGESSNFDGPILRCVHPGLAHLGHMYRGSCGRLERMEMEAEWDDNQRRLEKLTELGYLEYTLGPQCGVCAGRE